MNSQVKKIILAPMEGVIDGLMRKMLCSINPYDLCITEFLRVVDKLEPKHKFHTLCPELNDNGFTSNQTPVRIQLLGQNPNWLAENANRAIELGSHGVDINFGCPAKTVNKSKGGAVLLQEPELIYQILSKVRSTVTLEHAVSAKIRLGFNDSTLFNEIIDAVYQANITMLTIHARTKKHGYKPPAYWDFIGKRCVNTKLDVIANGEVWTREDAASCIDQAKTQHIMLGRGALAMPNLGAVIKQNEKSMTFQQVCLLLLTFAELENNGNTFYFSSRLKQWLKYLKLQFPIAQQLFEKIKPLDNKTEIKQIISSFLTN